MTIYLIIEMYGGCLENVHAFKDEAMRDGAMFGYMLECVGWGAIDLEPEDLEAKYDEYRQYTDKEEYIAWDVKVED